MMKIFIFDFTGKSLDAIMQLKEQTNNKDLFNAFSNEKKKRKKIEQQNKNAYNRPESTNVFDFINNKLSKRKGRCHYFLLLYTNICNFFLQFQLYLIYLGSSLFDLLGFEFFYIFMFKLYLIYLDSSFIWYIWV